MKNLKIVLRNRLVVVIKLFTLYGLMVGKFKY